MSKGKGLAASPHVETLIDLSHAWEGVTNDATAAEKHPEKFEEFKRRLAILIKETERRR